MTAINKMKPKTQVNTLNCRNVRKREHQNVEARSVVIIATSLEARGKKSTVTPGLER